MTGIIVFQAGAIYKTAESIPYFLIATGCVYISINVFALDVDNLRDGDSVLSHLNKDGNDNSNNNNVNKKRDVLISNSRHKLIHFVKKHKNLKMLIAFITKIKKNVFSSTGKWFFHKVVVVEIFEVGIQISGMMHNSNEVGMEITLATTTVLCLNMILMPLFVFALYKYCGKKKLHWLAS
jgi:hypothetical protein